MATSQGAQLLLDGQTRKEGQRLIRGWFDELNEAAEAEAPACYVFVMGSMAEILRALDINMVIPEVNSLQTAVRKVSMDYLNVAENYGYSPDVCSYVKADVGVHLRDRQHPMGRVPKPGLILATNMCNTYIKWAEFWERTYSSPMFTLDLPGMRRHGYAPDVGSPEFEEDRRYVEHQIREFIRLCEEYTGRKLDIDRLREIMGHVNRMGAAYKRVMDLNCSVPAPFNALGDGLTYMGIANAFRGRPEGAEFMELAARELQEKVDHGIGHLADERFRLYLIGTFCYVSFRRFLELFENWGGVFVNTEYLHYASGGLDRGIEYDLTDPIKSLAEQTLWAAQNRMSKMFFAYDETVEIFNKWRCDGVICHAVKSCRTVSTVLADHREYLANTHDISTLLIESDLLDARCWSEAQMKNRVDAYFEALENRRFRRSTGQAR